MEKQTLRYDFPSVHYQVSKTSASLLSNQRLGRECRRDGDRYIVAPITIRGDCGRDSSFSLRVVAWWPPFCRQGEIEGRKLS